MSSLERPSPDALRKAALSASTANRGDPAALLVEIAGPRDGHAVGES